MKNELKEIFSIYIQKVETIIGNKKAQAEKWKAKDSLSLVYINPQYWLLDRIAELEKSSEFKELVSTSSVAFGGEPVERLEGFSLAAYKLRNFFRRSGCYLRIWDGNSINVDDYFDLLWASYNEREIKTTTLRLLDSVTFPKTLMGFGHFKIQKFSKEELDALCQNKINCIFYPNSIWKTDTLSDFWFIREDEPKPIQKVNFEKPKETSNSNIIQLEPEIFNDLNNLYKVPREFPDPILQQLVLFGWDDDLYRFPQNESIERTWTGFSIPVTLKTNDDLTSSSPSAPAKQNAGFCVPDIDPTTGEEIERLHYSMSLSENELKELQELVKKSQEFSKIRPDQWEFLDTAMGYLAKAFFTDDGLEQLLWHMAVLESLFCIKGKKVDQSLKKGLDIALRKPLSNKQLKKLYDFRSDLVHGRTESKQVYTGHLWQARDLARRSVVWFLNYLLTCDDKKEYPNRNDILNRKLAVG